MYVRCKRSFDEIASEAHWSRAAAERPRREFEIRPWQATALDIVKGPVDERKVYFFVDPKGNAGKSFFCQHICRDVPDLVVYRPGRTVDLAYILRSAPRVVLFDMPRSTEHSAVPWDFLESLKDGYVCSTKYAGVNKVFSAVTVIVMCNKEIWLDAGGVSALSEDRVVVHNIE